MLAVARQHRVHAVRDYLARLRWDGAPRLDLWLHRHLGVRDVPLTRAFASKFLIGAVARARQPGAKVDHMLILEGDQGLFKSSALEALMPATELFTDDLGESLGKDAAERIAGKWLVEVAELDAMGKAEVTRIKSFITRRVDRFRPAYGRWAVDSQRQCVFAGTTNADVYLKDETGGRRFWPVRIGAVDLDGIRRERDQIWAEAVARHAAGERWWLESKELIAAAGSEQRARFVEDVWQDEIERMLIGTSEVTISSASAGCSASSPQPCAHGWRRHEGTCAPCERGAPPRVGRADHGERAQAERDVLRAVEGRRGELAPRGNSCRHPQRRRLLLQISAPTCTKVAVL